MAPDPEVMSKVPASFKPGGGPTATYTAARAYTDGLGAGNVTAKDIAGCYMMHGCCFSVCPTCLYQVPCGNDCACIFPCFLGIPVLPICICICERDGNAWVNRDKHGLKTGETILVDKETGTFACYSVKCCSTEFNEESPCHGKKCCCGGPVPLK